MRLIITRHGLTEENKQRILQGHMPGTLSDEGVEQARKLAERLKEEKIEAIYSSPLGRAADTAKIIATQHPEAKFILSDDLKETDIGKYTGKRWEDFDWKNKDGIESRESVRNRAKCALDKAYDEHPDDTVVFVGHAGINKALIRHIQGLALDAPLDNIGNTAVNIFNIEEDGNHKVHLIGCTKHLE